jgi:hypothetical protein
MGTSKSLREERRRWLEKEALNPTPIPPPPPWTDKQKADADKMQAILKRLLYTQSYNFYLVSELLQYSYLFEYSSRLKEIREKESHYRELRQPAAKEKIWNQLIQLFPGLDKELSYLRSVRDRDGANPQ